MINSINNQITSLIGQISSGKKTQTPLERVRSVEAEFEISRLEKAVELSNRLEIRINQQADTLEMIDENLNRVSELMLDDDSYNGQNADIVNNELTALRNNLVDLLNTTNIQGDTMFDLDRKQFDGKGVLIEEFGDRVSMDQAVKIIDRFINNKDVSLLGELQDVQESVLVELTRAGLKMQQLDDARNQSNKKIMAYEQIQSMNSDLDMTDAISRLNDLRAQQEAVYKATALTQNNSLFKYL